MTALAHPFFNQYHRLIHSPCTTISGFAFDPAIGGNFAGIFFDKRYKNRV